MQTHRTLIYSTLGVLFFIVLIFTLVLGFQNRSQSLKVTFFDVGQGDAILISEGSHQVLIDGGKNGQLLLERLGRSIPFWDRTIEVVVATHPDQDHIGGLIDAVQVYDIEHVLATKARSDSGVFARWEEIIQDIPSIDTYRHLSLTFPSGAVLKTLYPQASLEDRVSSNTNDTSIAMKLTYGETEFLFTGDLGKDKERVLDVGEVEVFKVGHHGSKSSTDEEFLQKIRPQFAIISAGEDNRYGHPASEVMERLHLSGAKVLETSKKGSIQYVCKKKEDTCDVRFF